MAGREVRMVVTSVCGVGGGQNTRKRLCISVREGAVYMYVAHCRLLIG